MVDKVYFANVICINPDKPGYGEECYDLVLNTSKKKAEENVRERLKKHLNETDKHSQVTMGDFSIVIDFMGTLADELYQHDALEEDLLDVIIEKIESETSNAMRRLVFAIDLANRLQEKIENYKSEAQYLELTDDIVLGDK